MISGCAQADVAILMLDGSQGSFENGFVGDGQTRERTFVILNLFFIFFFFSKAYSDAMLARSLGVTQLIVAVNKLGISAYLFS